MSDQVVKVITQQGPIILLLFAAGWSGWKKVWIFRYVMDEQLALKDEHLKVRELRIAEIREDAAKHLASLASGWEARLKEKDEECERERTRGDRLEAYTDRLIDAAMEATVLATRAVGKKEGP